MGTEAAVTETTGVLWPTPSMGLTDEQAAEIGRILVRHLRAGATIKGTPTSFTPGADGTLDGQVSIYYEAPWRAKPKVYEIKLT